MCPATAACRTSPRRRAENACSHRSRADLAVEPATQTSWLASLHKGTRIEHMFRQFVEEMATLSPAELDDVVATAELDRRSADVECQLRLL